MLPPPVAALTWDQYQSIAFRQDHALWGDVAGSNFQAKFFHLGIYFKRPVRMFEVAGGQAQELAYDPAMFDFGKSGLKGRKLPGDLGFAGFRLNSPDDIRRDWAAFLGASYFRAVGSSMQYGLSARGLAIDTGMPRPEEFPDFIAFWLERPAPGSETVVVYALLDSPSVAGAYRFAITKGEPLVMDVDAALYPRREIERLGIAPATSMYQVSAPFLVMLTRWGTRSLPTSFGLTKWVMPKRSPQCFLSLLMSTPMIMSAPASRSPWMTLSPMPPSPKTIALAPSSTFAVLSTAPTPVVTPQPM